MKTLQKKIDKFFKTGNKGVALFNRYARRFGLDFTNANFYDASFRNADFENASFTNADFENASFENASFRNADFENADFENADFENASFRNASFTNASFINANFYDASFRNADFENASFTNASFINASFYDASFRNADFRNIYISQCTIGLTIECPEEGSFVAYKKASGYIVKLQILEDAKRSSATTKKCRASKVKTLSITNIDGSDSGLNEVSTSRDDSDLIYRVGEIIEIKDYDNNRWNECATGVHFFMNRQIAVNW